MNMADHKAKKNNWQKIGEGKSFRIAVFVISLLLLYLLWINRDDLKDVESWGFLGIFVINFISNATIILPAPGTASVFVGGAIWNPLAVGLLSGIGAAFGELFAYFLGFGGRGVLRFVEKGGKWVKTLEGFFHRAGFITTFVYALIPLPFFDVLGIIAGAVNYPVWKFFLAVLLGRIIRNVIIALSGAKFLTD
ncbi:MAG: hypothetical protein UV73_C0004G0119 [Candidatus Gottesmanbacteria bacterium GW2011_GWA2_43_14]|uniref:VTT domain-containing protein n=1 Tax=Candidatus Gottesmanbacteria bacterium GW2011_GWA2_43_14 TaxID=1618443 RepID=A0A0G1DK71_9BACT|nr:MAG: hypothetical protein UV73_C0004G0119 [Candidatus Gottesmanbacteria bacterium GW2011_GWA2_43_14]